MKAWPVLGILFIEGILFLAHWFLYLTSIDFFRLTPAGMAMLRAALLPLAFSFVVAALLSYRFGNWLVVTLYRIAAIWLGFLNFLFFAACMSWLLWAAFLRLAPGAHAGNLRPRIALACFGLAIAVGIFGMVNARLLRTRLVAIKLPNLPPSWRGRTALVFCDLHLGHIHRAGFSRRIAAHAARLRPEIIFIPGDVFDGTKVDAGKLLAPLRVLAPPLGSYFVTGNHDEFGDRQQFLEAVRDAGIRVLHGEKMIVDGLQILGVPYHETTFPQRLRATLAGLAIDRDGASILLSHVPNRLPIVAEAGIGLQLSGHTHGGQFLPYTWLTRRVFGEFTHGLNVFGALQIYTSFGAGSWGPPMRVGTFPELVLIRFE